MTIELAGCVIRNKSGNILLLHRNASNLKQWEIPGGKIDKGETAEQAAVRELREELGVIVAITEQLGAQSFVHRSRKYHYTWFSAEIITGKPAVMEPETFDELCYFSIQELHKEDIVISKNVQNFLARIERKL